MVRAVREDRDRAQPAPGRYRHLYQPRRRPVNEAVHGVVKRRGQPLLRDPQPRLDGAERLVEPPRDLAVRQAIEVRQHHDPALLLGQRRERGVHLTVHRPPRHRRLVGRRLGPRVHIRRLCLLPPLGLAPPPPAPPQGVERAVPGDGEYPRHEGPALRVVLVDPTPHPHEHVTYHLLGLRFVLQDAKSEAQHPRRQEVVQLRQRPLVRRLETPDQALLYPLTKTFWL